MFQALRIRDFRLLWGGSVISSLGTWLLVLAIPAHVLLVTGSLRDTGLTLAAQYLPVLILGPVAGVVTDRWDRRRLMIATSLFRAGAVAVMLLGTSPGRYWVLYAALIAESSGGVLYIPAWQARTPAMVGTGTLLSSANSLNALADGAVRLIGGPLGGVLLTAFGVRWLIGADALSYLVSAAANALTSRPGTRTRPGPAQARAPRITVRHVARDLAEGARVLRGQPVARALLLVTVIFLAANASLSAMLIPARDPPAGRRRKHRIRTIRARRRVPARRPAPARAAGPGPAAHPADRHPDRHRRRPVRPVHLDLARHRAARRGRHRHVRLDVRGDPADRPAARHPQRGPRPDQRRLPDRRGRGRPARRAGRPLPGPGRPADRPGHRGQPGHAGRGRADPPDRAADARDRPGTGTGTANPNRNRNREPPRHRPASASGRAERKAHDPFGRLAAVIADGTTLSATAERIGARERRW